jgi:hypothetical protein
MMPDAGSMADAGVTTIAPTAACEALAAAKCALKKRCYIAFQREEDSACTQNEQARCLGDYSALQSSFDQSLVTINAARVMACNTRMSSSACPPTFPPDYPAAVARPFADCTFFTGLLDGTVPAGETCVNAQECAAGTVCIKPSGVCRGVCSTAPKLGENCAFGCARGLICGADGKCAALKPIDTPCDASPECESDLICLSGACRPRRKLGDSCTFDPTVPSTCEPGLACDVVPFVEGIAGTCVRPKPLDAPCRFHWSCQSGLLCSDIVWTGFPDREPRPGTCRAPDDQDTVCYGSRYSLYVGDQCKAGSSCELSTGICKPTPTRGQPCTPSRNTCTGVDTYCKPSGSGDVGTCAGPAAMNEPCAYAVDADTIVSIPCASGWCDRVNTLTCRPASKPLNAVCAENAECMSGRCAVQPDRMLRCTEAC